jgi:signal transduction histidine kinase
MSDNGIVVTARVPWWTTGRLVAVIVSLVGLLVVLFILTVVLKTLSDRRGQQLYEEKVAHVRTEAKVEERTRLAIELHDAISQTLTGVALQIDSADMVNNGGNGQLGKFLNTARWMLGSCRRELQDCLWDLRSRTFVETDMTEAVNLTIAPHRGSVTTSVRFNVPRDLLSESTAHSILRMVRELVVNAIRHGKATHVWIAGECSGGCISFSVRDNGCGFDPASTPGPRDGHFGLQGIRERVRAAKGTINIESTPSKGAKITITVPEGE